MLSAHESYTMDNTGYINLINCLESMTPFEAIRQAEEINKVNGIEVVSRVVIAGWKRKMKNQILNIEITIFEKSNVPNPKGQNVKIKSRKLQKDILEIKKQQLQKGYMKMLN